MSVAALGRSDKHSNNANLGILGTCTFTTFLQQTTNLHQVNLGLKKRFRFRTSLSLAKTMD